MISTSSAKSRSSRTAAARCCEPPQAPRSIPYAAPSASRCHPSSRNPARGQTSPIVWCLKRPMARKPLMHNYIYFETLEVGPDTGSLTPRPPPLKGVPECVERGDHVRARSRHRRHTVPCAHETIGAVSRLNDRHFAYSRPFQFALPVGVEEILVAARRAARECEEATSFIGLRGDRCRRLVTLEFEIHIARNARPFRYMLLDRGIPLHRSAAVLATPTLPIPKWSEEHYEPAINGYLQSFQRGIPSNVMGSSDLSNKVFGYAERNVGSAFEFAQRLVQVRDVQSLAKLQMDFIQAQMQAMTEQAKDLSETATKALMDSAKTTTKGGLSS